ncbi:MAG: glutamyl-tRNA amidotransferase, partial [Gemmatimonadetes bacterium]
GTDTGNSIRGPSSHLALVGIRSTLGLTSRDGVIPLSFDRDVAGPMARTVEDAARLFNVVVGVDPADPYTEDGRGRAHADYTAFLDRDGLAGARLGVVRQLVDPAETDTAVARLFEAALDDLESRGAILVDPLRLEGLFDRLSGGLFCRRFRYDMHVYLESLGEGAPIHDVADVLETGQYSPYVEDRLRRFAELPADVHPRDWDPPCPDFFDHAGRMAFRDFVVGAMDAAGVDALVYPTWTAPPAHLDRAVEEYRGDNSQILAPAAGLPAITVPMGFTYGSLPAGLQLLARPYREDVLFRLAFAYEQATHHRRPPERFPPLRP